MPGPAMPDRLLYRHASAFESLGFFWTMIMSSRPQDRVYSLNYSLNLLKIPVPT